VGGPLVESLSTRSCRPQTISCRPRFCGRQGVSPQAPLAPGGRCWRPRVQERVEELRRAGSPPLALARRRARARQAHPPPPSAPFTLGRASAGRPRRSAMAIRLRLRAWKLPAPFLRKAGGEPASATCPRRPALATARAGARGGATAGRLLLRSPSPVLVSSGDLRRASSHHLTGTRCTAMLKGSAGPSGGH